MIWLKACARCVSLRSSLLSREDPRLVRGLASSVLRPRSTRRQHKVTPYQNNRDNSLSPGISPISYPLCVYRDVNYLAVRSSRVVMPRFPWNPQIRWISTTANCQVKNLTAVKNRTLIRNNQNQNGIRCHSKSATSKKEGKEYDEERDWTLPKGLDTGIKMYNSLTKRKEPLILPNGRQISWYACGPTVYDHAHIGHASSYVRSDIIRRVLMHHFNLDVVLAMGVTDIDDKIIKRSKEAGVTFRHLTRAFEDEFFKDMDALNVLPPTVKLRVTEHLPQVNYFINRLITQGFAYTTPTGSVYFDVQAYGRYGRLWTHSLDTQIRSSIDRDKKGPRDFALWKAAKPDEPSWESPWGKGRPGWHIECSTMASTIFGERLDIHSGGDDLRFPHHENEMAQSEACFCSHQWTNYWIHTGHLHLKNDKTKMSKSLNNTISVGHLLSRTTSGQFRLFCMLRPYRQLIEYSPESLQKAVRLHDSWMSFLALGDAYVRGRVDTKAINEPLLLKKLGETKTKVDLAMADDFDTPGAIKALEELIRAVNTELNTTAGPEEPFVSRSPGTVAAVVAYVERMFNIWGLQTPKKKMLTESDARVAGIMDTVIKFRGEVRKFALKSPAPTEKQLPKPQPTTGATTDANQISDKTTQTPPELKPKKSGEKVVELLQACDQLRDELNISGINIQDHGKTARWYFMDKKLPSK